jgi:hypothetical protein
LRKLLLLAAMLAMVLAAAAPALAQQSQVAVESGGGGINQAQCQNQAFAGNQLQYQSAGDQTSNTVINQNCVANAGGEVEQLNIQQGTAGGDTNVVSGGKKFVATGTSGKNFAAVGTTTFKSASVPVFVDNSGKFFTLVNNKVAVVQKPSVTFFKTATTTNVQYQYSGAVQYQYAGAAQYQYAAAVKPLNIAVLPDTGGAPLITLGAGALLVAGGLLARRIVR